MECLKVCYRMLNVVIHRVNICPYLYGWNVMRPIIKILGSRRVNFCLPDPSKNARI